MPKRHRQKIRSERSREEKVGSNRLWIIDLNLLCSTEVLTRSLISAGEGSKPLLSVFWGPPTHTPPFHLSPALKSETPAAVPPDSEGDSSHRQHVPCHCHLPLHAVDSAEYCGRVRRAHRLHEHWLAGGISPHPWCRLRPPWGHHSWRGLQAHFRHLRPLYKTASPAAWNTVWTVCHTLWGDCQRVLAGYFYLPGGRDPAAVCCGVHLSLHHVLPKYHEEEHLQRVRTAARDRRWDLHTIYRLHFTFLCILHITDVKSDYCSERQNSFFRLKAKQCQYYYYTDNVFVAFEMALHNSLTPRRERCDCTDLKRTEEP